jgi:endonuclease I
MRTTIFLIALFLYQLGWAFVSVSSSEIDFGLTDHRQTKNLNLSITSTLPIDQEIRLEVPMTAFSTSASQFVLQAGQDTTITISFTPGHNVSFEGHLFVVSNKASYWKVVDLKGACELSGYYAATNNLYGKDLVDELKRIISNGYRNLGYTGARDAMYSSIDNVNGQVECVYTGRKATFNSRSGANSNSFNCEHTFPQSLYNKNEPERADIHHLFPTDVSANSRRANYPFGEVSSSSWSSGGSELGSGRFEPRDQQKGRTARALLYFLLRYTDYSNFIKNHDEVLVDWHFQYAPEQVEKDRNDAIFQVQKNRNPFIDHPEFIERILPWALENNFDWEAGVPEIPIIGSVWGDHTFVKEKEHEVWVSNPSMFFDVTVTTSVPPSSGISVDASPIVLKPGEGTQIQVRYESTFTTTSLSIIGKVDGLDDQQNTIRYTFSPVSLHSGESGSNHLHLYPNPAQNRLVIRADKQVNSVELHHPSGRLVHLTDTLNSLNEYQLPQLTSGVYFVLVHTNDGILRKRLMIHQP